MITASIKDEIIHINIVDEMAYEDFLKAVNPIFESKRKYIGFVSDGRKMTKARSALDQKRLADHHQKHNPDKPNAILMNPGGAMAIAKIYISFTGAKNTKVFTSVNEAIAWIKSFK